MKIILIYTPRCGSTSILKYFEKLKPEYKCYNEPWFDWMVDNVHKSKIDYSNIASQEDVFVKSALKTLSVPIETIVNDFDKVIFLLRKNKKEQVESSILAHNESSFTNYKKRKYNISSITNEELELIGDRYDYLNNTLTQWSIDFSKPLFYYEDLYYGSFDALFNELDLEYNEEVFNQFLNTSNRYRDGEILSKDKKTLI